MVIRPLLKTIRADVRAAYNQYRERRAARRILETISPQELTYGTFNGPQKSKRQIEEEIFHLWVTHRGSWTLDATIRDYFLMGCDAASADTSAYVFQEEADGCRNALNPPCVGIMNEKDHIAAFLAYRGVNATRMLGRTDGTGQFHDAMTRQEGDFTAWLAEYGAPVFAKAANSNQGRGCFKCEKRGGTYLLNDRPVAEDELRRAAGNHLVERYIEQDTAFAAVHPQSVNDVRIVTARVDKEIRIYGAFARFGVGDMHVDNFSAGGLAVGVRSDGRTADWGYVETGRMRGSYLAHPDSGVVFSQYTIPQWEQCCELARAAHREFPFLHSCGWDVAITPEGPIIIEGNAWWASVYFQYWFGPWRERMHEFFPNPAPPVR